MQQKWCLVYPANQKKKKKKRSNILIIQLVNTVRFSIKNSWCSKHWLCCGKTFFTFEPLNIRKWFSVLWPPVWLSATDIVVTWVCGTAMNSTVLSHWQLPNKAKYWLYQDTHIYISINDAPNISFGLGKIPSPLNLSILLNTKKDTNNLNLARTPNWNINVLWLS